MRIEKDRLKRLGHVYLIRADNDLYKIGFSRNAERRLRTLQSKCACTLELLWWIDVIDGYGLESALHWYYAEKRHHGEWFALTAADVEFILKHAASVPERVAQARRLMAEETRKKYGTWIGTGWRPGR